MVVNPTCNIACAWISLAPLAEARRGLTKPMPADGWLGGSTSLGIGILTP